MADNGVIAGQVVGTVSVEIPTACRNGTRAGVSEAVLHAADDIAHRLRGEVGEHGFSRRVNADFAGVGSVAARTSIAHGDKETLCDGGVEECEGMVVRTLTCHNCAAITEVP